MKKILILAGRPLNCELHSLMKKTRNLYHLHIRKNKRMMDNIKRDDLLNCCLNETGNIFDEVKNPKKCHQTFVTSIVYQHLYNNVDDQDNLRIVEDNKKLISTYF